MKVATYFYPIPKWWQLWRRYKQWRSLSSYLGKKVIIDGHECVIVDYRPKSEP